MRFFLVSFHICAALHPYGSSGFTKFSACAVFLVIYKIRFPCYLLCMLLECVSDCIAGIYCDCRNVFALNVRMKSYGVSYKKMCILIWESIHCVDRVWFSFVHQGLCV